MLCNSCFPPPLHQLWPLLGNRQAVKLVFFCILNFAFPILNLYFAQIEAARSIPFCILSFCNPCFPPPLHQLWSLMGNCQAVKLLHFEFCILHFVFCILNSEFCIFSSPLHQLWPLLGIRQAVKLCFFGTSPIQQWN